MRGQVFGAVNGRFRLGGMRPARLQRTSAFRPDLLVLPEPAGREEWVRFGLGPVMRCVRREGLLASVRRQADMEEWKARSEIPVPQEDLYGHEWHTTLRGAALETVAEQLGDAIAAFRAAGVQPLRK